MLDATVTRLLLLTALVACGHPAPAAPTPPPGIACAKVGEHVVGALAAAAAAPQEAKDKLVGQFSQSCDEDRWSESAKACVLGAADSAGMNACTDQLTPAQLDGLNRRTTPAPAPAPTAGH